MKKLMLRLVLILLFSPIALAQCSLRVDLRWRQQPNTVLRGPTGEVAPEDITRPVMNGAGRAYWDETTKKKYAGICLVTERPDYFVVWSWTGTASSQSVLVDVFAPGDSECLMFPPVFETVKVTNDQERSAKEAFKATLRFLANSGSPHRPTSPYGCVSPEKFGALPDPTRHEADTPSTPRATHNDNQILR